VIVVGGGFAGIQAVRHLRRAPVEVTLVDRQNFHLFQPLAYQVATGSLSPAEIATPLRAVFKRQANVRVVLAEVTGFDLARREVIVRHLANGRHRATLGYDTLVVAGGSHYSYFGRDDWRPYAPELKSLDGALEIRSRILRAFEAAELETAKLADVRRRRRGPDRGRDGGPDRGAGPRHGPPGLPRRRHPHCSRPAGRGARPRAHELPRVAVTED
jgi:NADH dehydrogenase FAD-containing subunit